MAFWDGTRWSAEDLHRSPARRSSPRPVATLILVAGLVGSGILGIGASPDAALGAQASLTVLPASGVPGDSVVVAGAGFPARARLQVTWDGGTAGLPIVTSDRSGAFRTSIGVPVAAPGSHSLGVGRVSQRGQLLASAAFLVLADAGSALPPNEGPSPLPSATLPDPTLGAASVAPSVGATAPPGSPTPGSPTATAAATAAPGGSGPTAAPTAPASPAPPPTPAPSRTPTPTAAPTPAPTAVSSAKLLFGLGSQAESAQVSALTTSAPIRILSSWYNGPSDLTWITDSYHRSIFQAAYAQGFSLHLITWTPEPETRFATPFGTTCGRAYPLSAAWLEDMRRLAQVFAGTASGPPLYVTLLTEFQTYPCVENAWSANAEATAYYQALIAQYEQAVAIFHQHAPNSRVSLGWGGWQASYDDPAIDGGRSLFPHFAGAMAKSDFMSFQAMHGVSNVQAIKDMTRALGVYGPVLLAHHMPDADTNPLSTVYRVFEEDIRALLTPTGVNGLVADGLFGWSILDDKPLQASPTTFSLVRDAVRAFGR